MSKVKVDLSDKIDIIDFWRQNPSIAATDLLHLPTSDSPDERYEFTPIQRVVINRIWQSRNSICVACRGFGKTRLAATMAILKALLVPGRRVGCLSASFRQAKQIFEEIDKIWERSPLLQQVTQRKPIMANDACKLDFKAVPGRDPSTIRALPLADGAKIRGSRFHTIMVDECVHVPEDVFNTVIRPMGATRQDPMMSYRIGLEKKAIMENTDYTEEEKEKAIKELESFIGANEIYLFTSGWYGFNYVYEMYERYSKRMHGQLEPGEKEDPLDFATFQIPYYAIPEDFLDPKGVELARKDMSKLQFRMEYEAAWILDTGGFFNASDIENCRANKLGLFDHRIQLTGTPGKMYFISIDPARTSDAFAILVSEFDPTFGMKPVFAEQFFGADAHLGKMKQEIFRLAREFNPIEIGMDKGGGGQSMADALSEGNVDELPIYDKNDDSYERLTGRHILKLYDFSSSWLDTVHHDALNMFENKKISFPLPPLEGKGKQEAEKLDEIYSTIERMIMQILNIEVSETKRGLPHFDLPSSGGSFEKHKDLYSAFLIGVSQVKNRMHSDMLPQSSVPVLGIIIPKRGRF